MRHLYNSKITIQESTTVKDDYGSNTTVWSNVSGLSDIPCRINWMTGVTRGEVIVNNRIVWLRDAKIYLSYYSNITTKMRAVYNSVNYDIISLDNVDEVGQYMTMTLKKVDV